MCLIFYFSDCLFGLIPVYLCHERYFSCETFRFWWDLYWGGVCYSPHFFPIAALHENSMFVHALMRYSMWCSKFSLLSRISPKYFVWETSFIFLSFTWMCSGFSLVLSVQQIIWVMNSLHQFVCDAQPALLLLSCLCPFVAGVDRLHMLLYSCNLWIVRGGLSTTRFERNVERTPLVESLLGLFLWLVLVRVLV